MLTIFLSRFVCCIILTNMHLFNWESFLLLFVYSSAHQIRSRRGFCKTKKLGRVVSVRYNGSLKVSELSLPCFALWRQHC